MIYRASEGMWLTQKKDVSIQYRVCTKEVCTGAKWFEKNWHEITDARKQEYDAEYEAWLREQENAPEGAV